MLRGVDLIGGQLAVNVLAATPENAIDVVRQAGGSVLVGLISKGHTLESAVARVNACHEAGVPVSVGLGAGDPNVWRLAAEVAKATAPSHVNQVFPTAGYTAGLLAGAGTVVNALISPTGTPGRVLISTGPLSATAAEPAVVSADTAAAMLKDAGVPSVKFFPLNGAWDELEAMAKAAARAGIPVFEPTGGLDASNVAKAARICLEAGCQIVVPHVYSAVVEKATGLTAPGMVCELVDILQNL